VSTGWLCLYSASRDVQWQELTWWRFFDCSRSISPWMQLSSPTRHLRRLPWVATPVIDIIAGSIATLHDSSDGVRIITVRRVFASWHEATRTTRTRWGSSASAGYAACPLARDRGPVIFIRQHTRATANETRKRVGSWYWRERWLPPRKLAATKSGVVSLVFWANELAPGFQALP